MQDSFGRSIRYLRLSVTKNCSLRCDYCRPGASATQGGSEPELSADEIEALVGRLARRHGLRKVRLTGGEPLLRPDLTSIAAKISAIAEIEDLALTTNGARLSEMATALAETGLKRVNISLDTLKPERFVRISGADGLKDVLDGIRAAVSAGVTPVKINTVVMRGVNDDELCDLLEFALSHGLEIRFIELMPMGPSTGNWPERFVGQDEIFGLLSHAIETKEPLQNDSSAARRWRVRAKTGLEGIMGAISAMSHPFCESCDRIRVLADGTICPCLMGERSASLLPFLRPAFDPEGIDRVLHGALANKPEEHSSSGVNAMTDIGG